MAVPHPRPDRRAIVDAAMVDVAVLEAVRAMGEEQQ
jgi:hypothetical protein